VEANFREKLAVTRQTTHRFHIEKYNHKKLHEVEGKQQCCVEISKSFAGLENLDTEVNINRAWKLLDRV
jgi:hypothetical protein